MAYMSLTIGEYTIGYTKTIAVPKRSTMIESFKMEECDILYFVVVVLMVVVTIACIVEIFKDGL